jgi:Domain of unknown function (DUF4337)
MPMTTLTTTVEKAKQTIAEIRNRLSTDKDSRDRWTGVYIGVIAAFMAVCTMLGNNATKDANRFNIEASNAWSFFQAKNLRRQMVRLHVDQLEMDLASNEGLPASQRTAYMKRIETYKALDKVLSSDKERNEGLDQLFENAKAREAQRDEALRKDPYFDWAQVLLQIALVLASVCLVTGAVWLLYASGVLGILGVLMMLDGMFMLVTIPGMS